jgi:predicted nucleic acid binding AN1-type Zn finger protein
MSAAATMKSRCEVCGKKTFPFECRCGKVACAKHRLPQNHACTYDFKAEGRRAIESGNPRVVSTKVEQI